MSWFQIPLADFSLIELWCLLAWVALLVPSLFYLVTTWRHRREFLLDRLGPRAIKLYYTQFFPSSASKALQTKSAQEGDAPGDDIEARFRRDFGRLYGRRHYIFPLVLLALIAAIGLRATSESIKAWLGMSESIKPFPAIAVSAFLGGYTWVLYDQFRRFRTGDFTAHDVYGAIYRFLIVIPLGVSLGSLMKDDVGVGVAFLLGAFPTTTLFVIARRLASQKFGLGESAEGGALELEKLQCVGRSNAERYVDEGISTIAELAWADPIDLSIKTNREFNFVVDSVSQALLWVYFEDRVKKLYPLSLRGAQEVCTFLDDLDSNVPKVKHAAKISLKLGAEAVELDEESFLFTLITVKDDPYAQFLFNVWA